jgi:hypothetical protein
VISLDCVYKQILFVIPSNQVIIVGVLCVLEKGLNSSLPSSQGGSNLSLSQLNPLETTKKRVVFNFKKHCYNHRMHIVLYFKPLWSRNLEAKNQKISKSISYGLTAAWGTSPITRMSTRVLIHFCFPLAFDLWYSGQLRDPLLFLWVSITLCVCVLSARDGRKVLLTLDKRLVFFLKAKNFIVPWVGLSKTKCRQEWPGWLIV